METSGEDPDDELDIILRPAPAVAARIIALAAVCRRAHLELAAAGAEIDDPEGERFDLAAWLVDEGLDPVLTNSERQLVHTRLGRLERDLLVSSSWQVEGLAALVWALELIDDIDWPANTGPILAATPALMASTKAFRTGARLRTDQAIAHERERAELWVWRAVTESELSEPDANETEMRSVIREVAEEAHAADLLPRSVGQDFPVGRRPFRALSSEERDEWQIIATERLRALNWVCGFGDSWDRVPLNV